MRHRCVRSWPASSPASSIRTASEVPPLTLPLLGPLPLPVRTRRGADLSLAPGERGEEPSAGCDADGASDVRAWRDDPRASSTPSGVGQDHRPRVEIRGAGRYPGAVRYAVDSRARL